MPDSDWLKAPTLPLAIARAPLFVQTTLLCASALLAIECATVPQLSCVAAVIFLVPHLLAGWSFGVRVGMGLSLVTAPLCAALVAEAWPTYPALTADDVWLLLVLFAFTSLLAANAVESSLRLWDAADRDPLTGLFNRRGFSARASVELSRQRRRARQLSVAYVDVDDFKRLNDTRGHGEGDRCLRVLADALAQAREHDVVARVGGDEFVVLMPDTPAPAASHALERLRQLAAKALVEAGFEVTFTAGISTFESPPISEDDLLKSADRALYARKQTRMSPSGRHMVVVR